MQKFKKGEKVICDGQVRTIYGIYSKNHVSLCLIDEDGYEYTDTEEYYQTPISKLEKFDFSMLKCPRCGGAVVESRLDGYLAVCDNCQEDFYSFELQIAGQKKKYPFYLDEKVTTWYRTTFEVEADNEEEARALAIEKSSNGELDELGWRQVDDTVVKMKLDDNSGFSTLEIFKQDGSEMIFQNGKEF